MSMTLTRSGPVVRASLTGELTVAEAAALYGQLFAELDEEASLVVDAGGVTGLDASIAQLFLFASKCVREFRVEAASAAWASGWTVLGLLFAAPTREHEVK
jgi:anti-anti-sigma regulatory factor